MDRNDLLATARAVFMRGFTEQLDDVIMQSEVHLFQKADYAPTLQEQGHCLDARAILLNQNIALKRQMVAALEHLLNRSFQTAYDSFRPSFGTTQSFANLSLVDTSTFEDELHVDGITKQFRHAAEDELRDLNIRIGLLFEQEDIRERENPFRPYLIARAICKALEDIQVPAGLMVLMSRQLAEDLTNHVREIYEGLNKLLADNGIAAQLQLKIRKVPDNPTPSMSRHAGTSDNLEVGSVIFPSEASAVPEEEADMLDGDWFSPVREREDELLDWVQAPPAGGAFPPEAVPPATSASGSPARAAGGRTSRTQAAPQRKSWLAGAKAVGEVLRSVFTGRSRTEGEALPDDYEGFAADEILAARPPSRLTESLHILQMANTPRAEAMLHSDGRVRNLILEHRDELSQMSRDDEEQMVIDVVAMLFEFILRDTQVPAEVRAQLGRLQFLVLKVALLDPALFSQKSHPARLLVNRIGSIVLGLQQIDPGGERVTAEICRIVEVLLSDTTGDVSLFSQMLDEFDAFVAAELRQADQQVDRAVQALENAQNRTVQVAHITGTIADAMSHITIDAFLHDFLVNIWPRVIERAGRDDVQRARRLRVLVPDLVWSIVPKPTDADRKQLFGLIPILLASIREGVVLIGWSEAQQEELIDWLIEAHRDALRSGNTGAQVPPISFFYEQFAAFVNTPDDYQPEPEADWNLLDGKLLDEAIDEMETELNLLDQVLDLDMNELMADADQDAVVGEESALSEAEVKERLRRGVAIEMMLETEPVRAHLTWVSQDSNNIVLTIEDIPQPSIVHVKVFKRLLETGRVRFVEPTPLFERAVHSLLESADQLDHRRPLPG